MKAVCADHASDIFLSAAVRSTAFFIRPETKFTVEQKRTPSEKRLSAFLRVQSSIPTRDARFHLNFSLQILSNPHP